MTSTKLIRWSGLFCMLAGILYALAALIHPAGEDVSSITASLWVPAHTLGGIGAVSLLFGLIGLYARQAAKTGWLMLVGFVLAFVGSTMLAMEEFQSVTVMPLIAAEVPKLIKEASLSGSTLVFGVVFLVSFFLGFLLFAIAIMRARVLPVWSGLLLILGLVLSFGGPWSHVIGIIAAGVFGLGVASMGYALWSEKDQVQP